MFRSVARCCACDGAGVDRFVEGAEAFNRGDMEAGSEGFAADAVFEPQAAVMEGGFTGQMAQGTS